MNILSSSIQQPSHSRTFVGESRKGKWSVIKLLKGLFLTVSLVSQGILSSSQSIPDPALSVANLYQNNSFVGQCTFQKLSPWGWSGLSHQDQNLLECYLFGAIDNIDYSINIYNTLQCPGVGEPMVKSQHSHKLATIQYETYSLSGRPNTLKNVNLVDSNDKVMAIEQTSGVTPPIACGVVRQIK